MLRLFAGGARALAEEAFRTRSSKVDWDDYSSNSSDDASDEAHVASVKNPAPSARPRIPKMMTMYASSTGPVPIPARREAPPKRESRPPAAATIAVIVMPRGLWRFGLDDCTGRC